MMSMYQTDDDESYGCEYGIHECDERLRPEYSTKSASYFASDDGVLLIEKCKIPSLHLGEKGYNWLALHHEYIGEDESDEELGQDDPGIAQISEGGLSDGFEILSIDNI